MEKLPKNAAEDVSLALGAIKETLTQASMALYQGDLEYSDSQLQIAEDLLPYQEKIVENNNINSLKEIVGKLKERIKKLRSNLNSQKNNSEFLPPNGAK